MRDQNVRFEERDIHAFAVIATGIVLLVGTLATVFLLWFVFAYFKDTHANVEPRPALAPVFSRIEQPLLQPAPARDLEALRARDRRILNGYHWIDQASGAVSIPIDRAIDKLVSGGMPRTRDVWVRQP